MCHNGRNLRKLLLILAVCAAALSLRLALAYAMPRLAHPDEIFQNLEQAHRLAYGYGIVPWEFRDGVRSWILPGLFAAIFRASDLILRVPGAYLIGATVFLSVLSLAPIVCGFLWAHRLSGERAAVVAAGFTAVWFELVYFAPAALSEVIATHILLLSLYLAFPGHPLQSRSRLLTAGVLLGLTFVLRIQLAPALAIIAIYDWRLRSEQPWKPFAIGFAFSFVGAGLLDWISWGSPWQSLWKYFYVNVVGDRSHAFGLRPWYYFVVEFAVFWSFALLPMLALIWLGARRMPLMAVIAATILVSHSMIAHKEYRFMYPAISMLIIMAGIGLSDVMSRLRPNSWATAAACVAAVGVVSMMLAWRNDYRPFLTASQGEIRAFRQVAADPQACGILLWSQRGWTTPGYTGLHRNLPMYEVVSSHQFAELESAANYVVTRAPLKEPGGFFLTHSFEDSTTTYLYERKGGCSDQHLSQRLANPDWFGDRERTDE